MTIENSEGGNTKQMKVLVGVLPHDTVGLSLSFCGRRVSGHSVERQSTEMGIADHLHLWRDSSLGTPESLWHVRRSREHRNWLNYGGGESENGHDE